MYEYLIINILVIFFPFVLSFDRKVAFFRNWKHLVPTYLTVGVAFVVWDVFATDAGHWSFNESFITGIKLFGLPVEEIMFFITVPYACIFTYEVIRAYMRDWEVPFNRWTYAILGLFLLVPALVFHDQGYTFIVLISLSFVLVAVPFLVPEVFQRRSYWIFILITMGLFLLVNHFLTSIPVVEYGAEEIWGGDGAWNGRFIHIPLEDFIYNISLLTGYLSVYLLSKRVLGSDRDG